MVLCDGFTMKIARVKFRVQGAGLRIQELGFLEYRVTGVGFRVKG